MKHITLNKPSSRARKRSFANKILATFVVTTAVIGGVFYLNDYYEASIISITENTTSISYEIGDFSDNFYDDPTLFYVVLENDDTYLIEPFDLSNPQGSFTNLSPNTIYQLKLIIKDEDRTVTIVEKKVQTNASN
ncbi:MAG: hypothetical protein ACLFRI_00510 [Candidatus Izemoplasmataceae bacterium]